MHGNRLITVFSASNYCGVTNNYGGILIFSKAGGRMIFESSRHVAPELESGKFRITGDIASRECHVTAALVPSHHQETAASAEPQTTQHDRHHRLSKDVLRQVAQLVVEHKPMLWSF